MLTRETVLYQRPQINLARSTPLRMRLLAVCAFLCVAQSALTDQGASALVAGAAVLAACALELIAARLTGKRTLHDGSALVSALVLALLLPNHLPPPLAACGIVFALVVVKYAFGGLGANWLNPALAAWLFIRFCWPQFFNESLAGTPLMFLAAGEANPGPGMNTIALLNANGFSASKLSGPVAIFLNGNVLRLFGAYLPAGYLDLFISPWDGIIADRAVLTLLLTSIIIAAAAIDRFWTGALYLGVYLFLVRVSASVPAPGAGGLPQGDMFFTLFSGGTLLAAFILLNDPAVSPKSALGAGLTAILAALLSWVFRCLKMEPYGALFAVALVNALTPLIRSVESRNFYEKQGET